jgi:hypothetical protein
VEVSVGKVGRAASGAQAEFRERRTADFKVSGELCATEAELDGGATVQLLIHGSTYSHDYWDFGEINGIEYSYARDVAARGFATFALDEIANGDSSRPPSDQVTIQSAAFVAHQIVQGLRDGPAANDPKFSASGLDSGYLTAVPGTRVELFYSAPDFDRAVLAADAARKDVVSGSEFAGIPALVGTNATLAIRVPVLNILGGNDATPCGPNPQGGSFHCSSGAAVATQEAPFYSEQARIHACMIPNSGHDVSLAIDHSLRVADTVAWSSAFVGQPSFSKGRQLENSDQTNNGLPWNDGLPWNCGVAKSK